ncbi:MAG: hypothetical protein LBG15_05945 [Dysgonamonadaceae bacterium]|jgi:positive regulator of sigma E activity|nr:hypothetical protein [Dysgonamonadaceae bacterium]
MKIKRKFVSGSFWLVMAIHIIVFTAIGLFSAKGWRLLIVFLSGLSALLLLFWLLRLYSKKHPERQRLAAFLSKIVH